MKESKKTMLVIAVTLLLAAALFVGAAAADGSGDAAPADLNEVGAADPNEADANGGNNTGDATPTPTEVADWNELTAAIAASASTDPTNPDQIKLTADIEGTSQLDISGKYVIIDGNEKTLTVTHTEAKAAILISGNGGVTLKNITIVGPSKDPMTDWGNGRIAVKVYGGTNVFEDVTIQNGSAAIQVSGAGTQLTLQGATNKFIENWYNGIEVKDGGNLVLAEGVDVTITPTGTPSGDRDPEGDHAYIWIDGSGSGAVTGTAAVVKTHPTDSTKKYWVINGDAEAEIDGVKYTTLALAIEKAADDDTVTLLKDVTNGAGIKIGETSDTADPREITIDLGGFTYTIDGAKAIGSGAGHLTQGIRIGNKETVTIQNGKLAIDSNNPSIPQGQQRVVWLINNYGNLTLGEDVVIDGSYVNKYATETDENVNAVVFSNTGSVNVTENASIKAPTGVPALYVGWFKDYPGNKTQPSICPSGTVATIDTTETIDGAVAFKMYYSTEPTEAELTAKGPKLAITAGNFKGSLDVGSGDKFAAYAKSAGIEVSGGSFNDFSALPYTADSATIVITLTGNVSLPETAIVKKGAEVNLDLAGYKVSPGYTAVKGSVDSVIVVNHGGNLTIGDSSEKKTGKITTEGGDGPFLAGVKLTNVGDTTETADAVLFVKGGTIEGKEYGISGNGSTGRDNTDTTITGGVIKGLDTTKSVALYQPQKGKLTISGGEFSGTTGVYVKCGNVAITADVSGGKFTATGAKGSFTPEGGDFTNTGDAFVVENSNYPGGEPSVTISGGEFNSKNAAAVASYANAGAGKKALTKFIDGGIFNTNPNVDSNLPLLKDGYVWDKATGEVVKEIPDQKTPVEQETPTPVELPIPVGGQTPVPEALTLTVNDDNVATVAVAAIAAEAPEDKGAEKTLAAIQIVLLDEDGTPVTDDMSQPATFVIKVDVEGLTASEIARLVIFHGLKSGDWEILTPTITDSGENTRTLTFTTKSCSPFVVAVKKPSSAPSKSSTPQGSSVWLTNDTPVEPTVTPTPTATPDVPGVKPVTPTGTPAKTPAPFVGILAGLGAAAVVFGLRRK